MKHNADTDGAFGIFHIRPEVPIQGTLIYGTMRSRQTLATAIPQIIADLSVLSSRHLLSLACYEVGSVAHL
jgi:hypothetical protein